MVNSVNAAGDDMGVLRSAAMRPGGLLEVLSANKAHHADVSASPSGSDLPTPKEGLGLDELRHRVEATLRAQGFRVQGGRILAPHSDDKARIRQYARQTRKLGLGWFFITQTPSDLNPGIWDQLAVRVVGYGLGGSDLRRIEEHVDDPEALRLYRSFPHPRSTDPRQYPFMLLGTVSPLSFTKAPVFLFVYTSFTNLQRDNHHWIRQQIRPTRG